MFLCENHVLIVTSPLFIVRRSPSREIWARFLAFESNIGDLASILKVERRRFTAFKDEYEGKETALLVDRYKFMDLYPCSGSELKALGYKVCKRARL